MKRKKQDSNFLPNIRCPFCNHVSPYAISGFAGELSVREKWCPKCEKEFVMVVYASSSIAEVDIDDTDGIIAGLRLRIKWLREQRTENKEEKPRGCCFSNIIRHKNLMRKPLVKPEKWPEREV